MGSREAIQRDGKVYLSRRYKFAAAHRLYSDKLSQEENERVFGKCANPQGHGHNYELVVTVAGPVDSLTGMCIDLSRLDDAVKGYILDRYDHRHLNLDVEDFLEMVPTGENIARQIWSLLEPVLGGECLYRIKLVETRDNYFEYYGDHEASI